MVPYRKISNNNVKSINCPIDIALVLFAQSGCNVPYSVLPMTYSVDVEEPCYTTIFQEISTSCDTLESWINVSPPNFYYFEKFIQDILNPDRSFLIFKSVDQSSIT